jgi:predicted component of type VI protein secretion system
MTGVISNSSKQINYNLLITSSLLIRIRALINTGQTKWTSEFTWANQMNEGHMKL